MKHNISIQTFAVWELNEEMDKIIKTRKIIFQPWENIDINYHF